ncbi:MAG: hypothetical protein ABF242_10590 [Flavobacteriales bacterium]
MKNFIFISTAFFFLFSCKKENSNTKIDVTITGKIVTDCAGTPFANQNFVLLKKNTAFIGNKRKEVAFSTDNEGNFKAEFPPTDFGSEVFIRIGNSGGGSILSFNTTTDLNIGTLNTTPKASYQIKIKVNNPYNVGDTLIINNHKGGGARVYKFAAPFSDTIIEVVNNYSNSLQIPRLENINQVHVVSTTSVISGISGTSSFSVKLNKSNTLYFEGCQTGVQTGTVIID